MQILSERPWYASGNAPRLTSLAFALIAVIAIVDAAVVPYFGFGVLYLIPLSVAAVFLSRLQILIVAAICAAFSEYFSGLPADFADERVLRIVFSFTAYVFVAVMVREMSAHRRAATLHLDELEREVSVRHEKQEELEIFINSSSAAIVALSPEGNILRANKSAHDMFAVDPGGLIGHPVETYLPQLAQIRELVHQKMPIECRGVRANGEDFAVTVALSTFTAVAGPRTAVIFVYSPKTSPVSEEGAH
jgi:PAS domain-containing protein